MAAAQYQIDLLTIPPADYYLRDVQPDEIDEDPAPGIEHGHPFHLQLPSGVVLRGRVDPQCEAELAAEGVTPNEVFAALQHLRDQHAQS